MSATEVAIALSPTSAARALDTSRSTVYRLMKDGELPYVRLGNQRRIAVADLERYVDRLRAKAGIDMLASSNAIGLRS
jgi:excisionase family DNA binding protein